jgi:hypothetical protein
MAQLSGFFNSANGDRIYDAVDFARYFGDLVTNGIFDQPANSLRVTHQSAMFVSIAPGSGWINGYHYQLTEAMDIALDAADAVNPRIDRVVLRLSIADRQIVLGTVKGVATPSPAPPALTRTDAIWELCLASVRLEKGSTVIDPALITDTRLDASLCGLVNSRVSAVYE